MEPHHDRQPNVTEATFVVLDQRFVAALRATFDAAMILRQSFGFFARATNDRVLADIAGRLRPGGRLLLDLYHPGSCERTPDDLFLELKGA